MQIDWRDEQGNLRPEYKFGYTIEGVSGFLETLQSIEEKFDFLRCLGLTFNLDQVIRFHASENAYRGDRSDEENRIAAEKAEEDVRNLKPGPGFREWIEARIAQLIDAKKWNAKAQTAGFAAFLTERGKALLPSLVDKYSNTKPKSICLLTKSLKSCNLLVGGAESNQRSLHSALTFTFGKIGTLQSFNRNWSIPHSESEIQEFRNYISSLLGPDGSQKDGRSG